MVVKKALFINHSCDLKSEYPNNINNKVAHISSIKSNPIVPYRSKPNMSVKTNSKNSIRFIIQSPIIYYSDDIPQ